MSDDEADIDSRLTEVMQKATKIIVFHVTLKPAIVALNVIASLLVNVLLEHFLGFGWGKRFYSADAIIVIGSILVYSVLVAT